MEEKLTEKNRCGVCFARFWCALTTRSDMRRCFLCWIGYYRQRLENER